MKERKRFFMECNLAARQYYDANEVWDKLKVGLKVYLVRDAENRYDNDAVAVVYRCNENDIENEIKLGYIPRESNKTIADMMDMGWGDIFECCISKINQECHYENQVRLTVSIKKAN